LEKAIKVVLSAGDTLTPWEEADSKELKYPSPHLAQLLLERSHLPHPADSACLICL
jgi:hypothetical protein